jgi:sulfite dehydrogenase
MKNIFAFLLFVFSAIFIAQSEPVKIELPVETVVYKPAPGADLANAQCLTCHSAEYISTQPPLPRTFWKASVDKMIGKYGAPIPTEQVEALAEYFAKNYGTDGTNASTIAAAVTPAVASTVARDVKKLMQDSGCFNCHNAQAKLLGPSYKDVAAKYRGHPEGLAKVSHQITHGGSGLWGPFPMPPFKQFSEAEVKMLAEWILEQK